MLALGRHVDEEIVIGEGENQIVLLVVEIRKDKVVLGFTGPKHIPVHRREVYESIKRGETRMPEDKPHPEEPLA